MTGQPRGGGEIQHRLTSSTRALRRDEVRGERRPAPPGSLLREATARARAKSVPEKAQLSIIRSLARLAGRIERETPTDPESKERAAHIRAVARDLNRGEAVTPPQRREPIVARQLSMLD
jgi:hypothetical protein